MRNTRILFIVMFMAAALLLFSGCGQYSNPAPTAEQPTANEDVSVGDSIPGEAGKVMGYTLEQIAEHNTPDDCWFAISGKVYDVSGFGEKHAGGETVYAGCGLDATELFETRPMGSGTSHSERARGFMPNFEIGELAQ
ncbi:MAG: cytochrome b5-like heme/steroid binding domain-containing protein [Patescibacteria group bacterium]